MHRIDRRTVLKGVAAAGLAAPLLPGRAFAQDLRKVRLQLSWVSNVQYAGDWIALENDLMAKHGVEVDWQPGGSNAPASLVTLLPAARISPIPTGSSFSMRSIRAMTS